MLKIQKKIHEITYLDGIKVINLKGYRRESRNKNVVNSEKVSFTHI